VAHGFDVVAVEIADEHRVVGGVVLGPLPRLVEHLDPGFDRIATVYGMGYRWGE